MNTSLFYPMSELPAADESDASFSKTVIIFGNRRDFVELGYFDFEKKKWSHFGENMFLLKCWCYIPFPEELALEWSALAQ